jgi:hypothetical protein
MERVIYCPNEAFIDESSMLAKKTNLAIVVGDNDQTEGVAFDRSSVQVLQIPQHKHIDYPIDPIKLGFHQYISYVNEFLKLRGNIEFFVNNEKIKPVYEETHRVKYLYHCSIIGEQTCQIHVNGQKVEDFSFYVD